MTCQRVRCVSHITHVVRTVRSITFPTRQAHDPTTCDKVREKGLWWVHIAFEHRVTLDQPKYVTLEPHVVRACGIPARYTKKTLRALSPLSTALSFVMVFMLAGQEDDCVMTQEW